MSKLGNPLGKRYVKHLFQKYIKFRFFGDSRPKKSFVRDSQQAHCKDRTQKYSLCPLKISRETRRKKLRQPKNWDIMDREPDVLFIQNSMKFEQNLQTKLDSIR